MEFQETKHYSFTPHCSLVSYRRGRRIEVPNKSEFTIHIKEYAPCVFSYYRELNAISVSSIVACFESFWKPKAMNQKQYFLLIRIDHRKKNNLLSMMRSLLTVGIYIENELQYRRFHEICFLPLFCCLFRIKIKQQRLRFYGVVIANPISLVPQPIPRQSRRICIDGYKLSSKHLRDYCDMKEEVKRQLFSVLTDNLHFLFLLNCTAYSVVFTIVDPDESSVGRI